MLLVIRVAMNSRTSGGHGGVVALGLVAEDGQAGLEVGRLDVGDQAPLEPAPQPILQGGDVVGHAIGRDDDLLVRAVQRVEGVEELLLQTLLALHELDVVDEQDVDLPVAALELRGGVGPDGVDVLVEEGLGRDVADLVVAVVLVDVVADGVEEVGLAQPGGAVDEERVVRPRRRLRHPLRGRQGELVGLALDEGLEGVAGVEARRRHRRAAGCR